jgi:hypothetical protein
LKPIASTFTYQSTALLESSGFKRQRPFIRMALDRATLPGDLARLAIAAGPEFG